MKKCRCEFRTGAQGQGRSTYFYYFLPRGTGSLNRPSARPRGDNILDSPAFRTHISCMSSHQPKTLQDAITYFADPKNAFEFAVEMRWPGGVRCPWCGSPDYSFLSTRQLWKCKGCKKQYSVRVGTIFEDSPIALNKWLMAVWMLVNCKNGVSSYELHRTIGVTQKTAWFMLHRIRAGIKAKSFDKKLAGIVETDETFIGGLLGNMHQSRREQVRADTIAGRVKKARRGHIGSESAPAMARALARQSCRRCLSATAKFARRSSPASSTGRCLNLSSAPSSRART